MATQSDRVVRIREHLYAEIEKRAGEEHRSVTAQLNLLLEQALGLRPITIHTDAPEEILGIVAAESRPPGSTAVDDVLSRRFGPRK